MQSAKLPDKPFGIGYTLCLVTKAVILHVIIFLLSSSTPVQAQFNYVLNNGTVTITKYTGPGGAVSIPRTIIGLPVTRIGNNAINSTISGAAVTQISIPNSIISIEPGAFWWCPKLQAISVDSQNAFYSSADGVLFNKPKTTLIKYPESKTGGDYTIGNSVTNIEWNAFFGCRHLGAITVEPLNSFYSSSDGALFDKGQSTLIQVPPNRIGTFTISNHVSDIRIYAFAYCSGLKSITIGTSVTNIGNAAFFWCSNLESITIPDSVIRIGTSAFYGCARLANITIPGSVISIEGWAFGNCDSLRAVYFEGNAPTCGQDLFSTSAYTSVYYLQDTQGWGSMYGGRPTALWYSANTRLRMRTSGQGTLSPNYSDAMLNCGVLYSMKAFGGNGYAFSKWILSTNWDNGIVVSTATLDFVMQSNLTVEAVFVDVEGPEISITAPTWWQKWSNQVCTIAFTAVDNLGVSNVWYQLNGDGWQLASSTSQWSAPIVLTQRTNLLNAYAEDLMGNRSRTSHVSFIYVVTSHLTLLTTGSGKITHSFTSNKLEVGRDYAVAAVPGYGHLFSNWSGMISARNNPLTFLMQSNLVLQANFVQNPYPAFKGLYVGLFKPSFTESISGTNAGSITLNLTERGSFSGTLRMAGTALPFTGVFDAWRQSIFKVARIGKPPLTGNLGFDGQSITGQVSTVGWAADLLALHQATGSNALTGRYSMLVMGQHEATDTPPGDGAFAVSVTAPSSITVSGTMADGSAVTIATGHTSEGTWPFYASLYGGRGLVIGWMSCATNSDSQEVQWVKPPDSVARYYPVGFREQHPVAFKRYLPPAPRQRATSCSLGRLLIGGGNLAAPLEAEVLVTNNLIKRLSGSVSNLSLVITNSNGRFGGSFLHPVTRKTTSFKGVLVQGLPWVDPAEQVTVGGGWFLGTNQAGYLWIEPKP